MLRLRVVQAEHGDCLLLEYGAPEDPQYILVDGGPADTYERHLRPELLSINEAGGAIDLLVLSHVDDDHIRGVLDLMEDLLTQRDRGMPETVRVRELWHNTFSETVGREVGSRFLEMMENAGSARSAMVVSDLIGRSIEQGDDLTQIAHELGIRVNADFEPTRLITMENAPPDLCFDGLTLRVIGPRQANLEKLKEDWLEWLEAHRSRVLAPEPDVAERAAREADRSVPNLSSIMLLAEAGDKRILLTGDGRGDDIVKGLRAARLLAPGETFHVDMLKLPHHGSARNVSRKFFKTVTADTYLICANGKHGNPDFKTLKWLVETAKQQGRKVNIFATTWTDSLDSLLERYDPDEYGYRLDLMEPGDHSTALALIP